MRSRARWHATVRAPTCCCPRHHHLRLHHLDHLRPLTSSTSATTTPASPPPGFRAATFVGHSLGTVYLSWVARLRPSLIASAVFIDPIVFLLHHHKVAHNFMYEKPSDALSAVETYFIKSEQRIVSYFHRSFHW